MTRPLVFLLLTLALSGCAADSPLGKAEMSCVRLPTPDARAECTARQKAQMDAYLAQQRADAQQRRAIDLDPAPAPKDKPGCFRRQSTGELVCPN